jgi:hypothetical protein
MKRLYRASKDGNHVDGTESSTPRGSWLKLEAAEVETREQLRQEGYRVNLVIDLEESDALVAAEVIETVAPKPVKGIIGIIKRFLGR